MWKNIIISIIIILVIFGAGFWTATFVGRNEHSDLIVQYENDYKLIEESSARKDVIIFNLGESIGKLEEGLRVREEITRRRDEQISTLESTISSLIIGGGDEQESLDLLERYYNEISRRIHNDGEEDEDL